MSVIRSDHPIVADHPATKTHAEARAKAKADAEKGRANATARRRAYDESMAEAVHGDGPVPTPPPITVAHVLSVERNAIAVAEEEYRVAIAANAEDLDRRVLAREEELLARAKVIVAELKGLVAEATSLAAARAGVRDVGGLGRIPATPARISWDTVLDAVERDRFLLREPYAGWFQRGTGMRESA